jgi:hypothetical protein
MIKLIFERNNFVIKQLSTRDRLDEHRDIGLAIGKVGNQTSVDSCKY